jgi:hypothetical protein
LAEIDPDLDFKHVKLSIFRACSYFTKNKTALLHLYQNTTYFKGWKQSEEKQTVFQELDATVGLKIDNHFYGLTNLNDPDPPITAEFVPPHSLHHCLLNQHL